MCGNHSILAIIMFTVLTTLANTVPLHSDDQLGGRHRRSAWTEQDIFPRASNDFFAKRQLHHLDRDSDVVGTYRAITFGKGHVITFDDKYYHIPDGLSSACPHILARDHAQFSFTIVRSRESITMYTLHAAITLHSNNKVEVNNTGTYRELPVQSWDNGVSLYHNNRAVIIQTKTGVLINCDLHHSECLFELKGSYFNHTIGLLGTNDNDVTNDFLMRSGKVTSDPQQFINYYELSGVLSCRPGSSPSHQCRSAMTSRCHQLFSEESSPLTACYSTVNPEPYKLACQHDTEKCHNRNKDTVVCDAVRAYVKMCQTYGLYVSQPHECDSCHHHRIGSSWTEIIHKKLDIVLVTSLSSGLLSGGRLGTMIYDMVHSIEVYLKQQAGIHNIRVGLLGYGSSGYLQKPHVYTIQGESFTRHYSSAIWREVLQSLDPDGMTRSDPVQGVKTSLNYPFRQSAVKIILLVTEQTCTAQLTEDLKLQLESDNIVLNIVTRARPQQQAGCVMENLMDLAQYSHGAIFDIDDIASRDELSLQHMGQQIHSQVVTNMHRCRQCTCQATASSRARSVCHMTLCN